MNRLVNRLFAPQVVGLDLSLTSTGIAVITEVDGGHRLTTAKVTSTGKRDDSLLARHARLSSLTNTITTYAARADLVVIEGPVTGGRAIASPVDRYSLFWLVADALLRRGVPVAVISPSAMKKAITGFGGSAKHPVDKVQVALAVQKLWPHAELGNNDTADAAALAHLGAVHLGWSVQTLERHKQVVAQWPVLGETA